MVYISPMDFGSAVFLAARNLKEFTDLLFTMKDAMEIGNFLSIEMIDEEEEDENEYGEDEYNEEDDDEEIEYEEEEFDEYEEDEYDEELLKESEYVLGKLNESLNCTIIEDVESYYKDLYEERNKQIIIATNDRIGIIPMANQSIIHEKYEVVKDMEIDIHDLQVYFQKTEIENKLAFVRDAQNLGIIIDHKEVRDYVVSELRKLGLKIEAERLLQSNENDSPSLVVLSNTITFGYYKLD